MMSPGVKGEKRERRRDKRRRKEGKEGEEKKEKKRRKGQNRREECKRREERGEKRRRKRKKRDLGQNLHSPRVHEERNRSELFCLTGAYRPQPGQQQPRLTPGTFSRFVSTSPKGQEGLFK